MTTYGSNYDTWYYFSNPMMVICGYSPYLLLYVMNCGIDMRSSYVAFISPLDRGQVARVEVLYHLL